MKCSCGGEMDLRRRVPFDPSSTPRLARANVGPPRRVPRSKRSEYMRKYRAKLWREEAAITLKLAIVSDLADVHYVCSSCGKTEGRYAALNNLVTIEPLDISASEKQEGPL